MTSNRSPVRAAGRSGRATRREFLGVLAGGAAVVGLAACGGDSSKLAAPAAGAAFFEPATLHSRDGRLDLTLVAAAEQVAFGRAHRFAYTYNGTTPGPTLRIRPGDVLAITLVNRLDHPTNLHTHGLHVSPMGRADNIFVTVEPGARHTYVYEIPADHRSGLFWYHPHHHGTVAEQVFGGLAGAIVIDDDLDELPAIAASRERVMILADPPLTRTADGFRASMMEQMQGREGGVTLINGVVAPRLSTDAGALERWRLLNASPSRYYLLAVAGHTLHVIGTDGGRLAVPIARDDLLLAPGERAEVLVAPARAGAYELRAHPYDRGAPMMGGGMMGGATSLRHPTTTLATLAVRGTAPPAAIPAGLATVDRLRDEAVDGSRTLTLGMAMGGGGMGGGGMGGGMGDGGFTIDGRSFDGGRTDSVARVGTIEDWTVRNTSSMDHPFHLHVWPFQVLDGGGGDTFGSGWKDTVNVPAGGSVTLRVAFRDTTGRTVYHCHILDHEDLGMMGVIVVR